MTTYMYCNLVINFTKFLLQHNRPVFFYKLCNPHSTPTFKTEALCLGSNVQLGINGFYCEMDGKYVQHYLGSNPRRTSLLRPHPSVILTASVV